MLVLSRKTGQRIQIGEGVHLIVLEIRGGNVRLGFEAPDSISIHREEVYHRIGTPQSLPTPIASKE